MINQFNTIQQQSYNVCTNDLFTHIVSLHFNGYFPRQPR